ncbi:MAG TPA: hypothetical protein VLE27_00635, partial [Thermoanaerobaculia bacterium]|nr:hypothetical protein [Thermoanaerobaculia bacterium]
MSEPCSCGGSCGCGCCEGVEPLTPQTIANRPGLDALSYRVGTHSTFLETMTARLSSEALAGLTSRESSDPSLALLDAWAVVGDVLSFYQERIANEGYLRTATERRSVLELARLVGYAPRPGVASSVYLAYTLDPGPEALIPAGAASRSVPGPGELPQVFETMEDLTARAVWNNLQVRLTRPQSAATWELGGRRSLWLKGITTQLKVNDPVLIGSKALQQLHRVTKVEPDAVKDRTRIEVETWVKAIDTPPEPEPLVDFEALDLSNLQERKLPPNTAPRLVKGLKELESKSAFGINEAELRELLREAQDRLAKGHSPKVKAWLESVVDALREALESDLFKESNVASHPAAIPSNVLLGQLAKPPKAQPRSGAQLDRSVADLYVPESDVNAKLLAASQPALQGTLYTAWANAPATAAPDFEVYALRTRASVFGHNVPRRLVSSSTDDNGVVTFQTEEWPLEEVPPEGSEQTAWLDAAYPQILPGSWVVLHRPSTTEEIREPVIIARVQETAERSRAAYGVAAKVT